MCRPLDGAIGRLIQLDSRDAKLAELERFALRRLLVLVVYLVRVVALLVGVSGTTILIESFSVGGMSIRPGSLESVIESTCISNCLQRWPVRGTLRMVPVTLARDSGAPVAVRLAVPALEPPLPARAASAAAFLAFIFSMRANLSLLEFIVFAWLVESEVLVAQVARVGRVVCVTELTWYDRCQG